MEGENLGTSDRILNVYALWLVIPLPEILLREVPRHVPKRSPHDNAH